MVGNMRFYFEEAGYILADITHKLQAMEKPDPIALLEAFGQFNALRKQAQDCAVDAAPYMHHRLASVEIKSDEEDTNMITTVTRRIINGTRNRDATLVHPVS